MELIVKMCQIMFKDLEGTTANSSFYLAKKAVFVYFLFLFFQTVISCHICSFKVMAVLQDLPVLKERLLLEWALGAILCHSPELPKELWK